MASEPAERPANRMRKRNGKRSFGYTPKFGSPPAQRLSTGSTASSPAQGNLLSWRVRSPKASHGHRQLTAALSGRSPGTGTKRARAQTTGELAALRAARSPPRYVPPPKRPAPALPLASTSPPSPLKKQRKLSWFQRLYTSKSTRAPKRTLSHEGFRNLGNTCYMNAVMQSLMQLVPFASELLAAELSTTAFGPVQLPALRDGSYLRAVVELAARLRQRTSQVISLRDVKDKLAAYSSRFRGHAQQDAQEFLLETLFHLHTDHALATRQRVLGVPAERAWALGECRDAEEMWRAVADETSAVRRNFGCVVEHTFVCEECGEKSTKLETYRDLCVDLASPDDDSDPDTDNAEHSAPPPVAIPSVYEVVPGTSPVRAPAPSPTIVPMRTLLERFFANAPVERTCESCAHPRATCHSHIVQLPRVLVVTLKRFTPNLETMTMDKVTTPVRVSRALSLHAMCTERTRDPPPFDPRHPPAPRPMQASPGTSTQRAKPAADHVVVLDDNDDNDAAADDNGTTPYERDLARALAQSREMAAATECSEEDALKRAIAMSLRDAEEAAAASEAENAAVAAAEEAEEAEEAESAVGMVEFATFLETVDAERFKRRPPQPCTPEYVLHSIVSHTGAGVSAGHYVCDVMHAPKQWRRYDDSVVHSVTDAEVRRGMARRNGYMFFLVHRHSAGSLVEAE